tara:strand:+ start:231 stop:662 length:432 start_codon:yes stop_codon:yes gene_type:complete
MDGGSMLERLSARERGPAVHLLGHRLLACDAAAQSVRVAYSGKAEFCNPMGRVQGGFLAAMLEQAMIDAIYCAAGLDAGAVTLELETQFLAPVSPGPISVEAHVTRLGRSIAFLAGQLQDGNANLCLTGSAVALLQPPGETGG